jgi:glycosyltransferase involved in cell wall biosynthesis
VPDVKLFLVGDGGDKQNLEALATELDLADSVVFAGLVPYPQVPEYVAVADIAVSPIPPLYIYKVSSPLKLFEYMAAGKPVVANYEIPEQKYVLENSGGGVLVSFDPEALAAGLIELLGAPERARAMGQAGREWVVEHRSYEILARDLERRYLQILERA